MWHRFLATIGCGLVLLMLANLPARQLLAAPAAVTFTVDSTLDLIDGDTSDGVCTPGSCSLRAAIMQANKLTAPGVHVILVPSGTYTLTRPAAGANGDDNGDLNLKTPVSGDPVISIVGAGAAATIIDANQIDGVIRIAAGRTASLTGITFRDGYTANHGGGIYNVGTLTVSHSIISGNQAIWGGGISNAGTLIINDSTLSGNQATWGGGINNAGTLIINDSTLSGNQATWGGGIDNIGSLLTVRNSTLAFNQAGADGGGLSSFGPLAVVNTTISQNSADRNGGGLFNSSAIAYLFNVTIVFNDADADADYNGSAGGVYNQAGTAWLINSLLAANFVSDAPVYSDCAGTVHANGRVLLWSATGCSIDTTYGSWTFLKSLSLLGPLQNNGGPTATHALLPGSNAIDGAEAVFGCIDSTAGVLLTDQRGVARGTGAACDIGAYEYVPPSLFLPLIIR